MKTDDITIGVCYGRFNPPHKGHREVWRVASMCDAYFIGTNVNTSGPNDPLPYDIKLKAMDIVSPNISSHVVPEKNLFTLVSHIYEQYGINAELNICTDEEWLTNSILRNNGVLGKHGYYKFNNIKQLKTPRITSSTIVRETVKNGDREQFSKISGISPDEEIVINKQAVKIFDILGEYLT